MNVNFSQRCQQSADKNRTNLASAVMWVVFVCDLLSYRFADPTGNPSLSSWAWQEEYHTLPPEQLHNLQQSLRLSGFTQKECLWLLAQRCDDHIQYITIWNNKG